MNEKYFGPEAFMKEADVSAAVLDRMIHYHQLLHEWNARINLVAPNSLPDAWMRHFMDSAQLFPLLPRIPDYTLVDLGSGAGFPALVLAIMGVPRVTLVERDTRKAAFLRTVAAQTGATVEILNIPIESIEGRTFDVITARALAEMGVLLGMAQNLMKPTTTGLFLKGQNIEKELENAKKGWHFEARQLKSLTDPGGVIVRMTGMDKRLS